VGDVSRAIADGVTGYVVPVRNADKLADALEPLLLDAGLRRRMGAAGRQRVIERFSSEVTARNVSSIYAELQRAAR
jgi:glycosyltransferase involved in cell wall biosynthesis